MALDRHCTDIDIRRWWPSLGSLLILGLHGQKPLSQVPERSFPSYDERFYCLGVLRYRSFCSIDISVDFLISQEGYTRASFIGIGLYDMKTQSNILQ